MDEVPLIHPTAIISSNAIVGKNTEIGPFTIIHGNVHLGHNSRIGGWSEIGVPTNLGDGSPLIIGHSSTIRSHSVLYESSTLGDGLVTGHHVCIRELTKAGRGLQLGSNGDIQGNCIIGDFLKTHRGVHVGQKSKIGNYVWMFPEVLLTNDPTPPSDEIVGPTVEDYVVLCAKSTLLPGVKVGAGAVIGAHGLVTSDVPAGFLATGNPAKAVYEASILRLRSNPATRAYPWRTRFHRGYPKEVVETWLQEFKQ